MTVRTKGWADFAQVTEKEVTGIFRGAAHTMYLHLADRTDTSDTSGSPLASGHYSASMRIGLNSRRDDVAPVDDGYKYPTPQQHQYSASNLPPPTVPPVPRGVIRAWLAPFKIGDIVYLSNASAYAITIEDGRRGKNGSWQKPRGVFLTTLDKLFAQQGWY